MNVKRNETARNAIWVRAIAAAAILGLVGYSFRARLRKLKLVQLITDRVAPRPSVKDRIVDVAEPVISAVDNMVGDLAPRLTHLPHEAWDAIKNTVVPD